MVKLSLLTLGMIVMTATSAQAIQQRGMFPNREFEKATFAGGCFWCMEPPFDKLDGVISTTSGYTGGTEKDPTYEQVSAGKTGHLEAIEVTYDPAKVSYASTALDVFWKNVDPTQHNGQFVDIGSQYRTAIFYHNEEQGDRRWSPETACRNPGSLENRLSRTIRPAMPFYSAEDYHQDYYIKNPIDTSITAGVRGETGSLKKPGAKRISRCQGRETEQSSPL